MLLLCYIVTVMRINNFTSNKALLVFSGLIFAFSISADSFLHDDSSEENSIECHICSNDVTESTIEINKIDGITKELPRNISATNLLDSQLSTSYSTRAPPTI